MKVSKEQLLNNRNELIAAATQLFQQQGFGATGVAQISERAGLTQGGFYGHFKTKGLLAQAACRQQFEKVRAEWEASKGTSDNDLETLIDGYVSTAHVDTAGDGCPMAAYTCEVKNQDALLKETFTQGFERMIEVLEETLKQDFTTETARRDALFSMCAMVGSVAIARATKATSPTLSEEILSATRESLKAFVSHSLA